MIGVVTALSVAVLGVLAFSAYCFCKGKRQNQDLMEEEELK